MTLSTTAGNETKTRGNGLHREEIGRTTAAHGLERLQETSATAEDHDL